MSTSLEMLGKIQKRRDGFSLDQRLYSDSMFFQLDLEHIFYREWLFVGHECELSTPGDYFTVQIGEFSLIIVRRDDGTVGALHNTCRHRGSRICSSQSGSFGRRLVCPYHQWTYHYDGRLATARQMGRAIESEQLSLKSAHCECIAGYIFVSLAKLPPDFGSFRA